MASASQYLSSKTEALTSTSPVSPSQAQAAQIPLQSFDLPTFPPEAFSAGLGTLILTADIKLDDYTEILTKPFSVPELPASIKSLTLELFSLGYPPGFLTSLGKRLPDLKALTIYSQLFGGTTQASREDALAFIRSQPEVRELHLLDVFGSPGFLGELAKALSPALNFLEVNYTYRHSDPQFLATIPSKDFSSLISYELMALTMSISAPDVTQDGDDREGTEVGMRPVSGKDARDVAEKLVHDGKGLVMLDATMFELSLGEIEKMLDVMGKLKVLNLTVGLGSGWDEVFEVLGKKESIVEIMEIVGVPGEGMVEELKSGGKSQLKKAAVEKLGEKYKGLKSLKVSILRTKMQHWVRIGAAWEKKEA